MRRKLGCWIAALSGLCAVAAHAAAPSFDDVVAGAAKEGKVVVWVQAPSRPETQRALAAAFNARFKSNIKVDWVVIPPTTANTRAIAEMAGGRVSVDVIGPGANEEVAVAAKAGLVKPYPWTQVFGATYPGMAKLEAMMFPQFKGDAVPYIVAAYGLAWNPTLLKDAEVPDRLTDLADPKWRGKFAVNAFFMVPMDIVSYAIGQQQALELARKLVANEPNFQRGTPAVARAVTTGEVPLGFTLSAVAEQSMRQKEPLKFKLFADVIPLSRFHLYVPEGAPDPDAARLFTAWMVNDGVKLANQYEPLSGAADPDSEVAKMIAQQVRRTGAKVAQPSSPADLAAAQKLREQIGLLLTGQAPQ